MCPDPACRKGGQKDEPPTARASQLVAAVPEATGSDIIREEESAFQFHQARARRGLADIRRFAARVSR